MATRLALTEIAQEAWQEFLMPGSQVLDATSGNGHDTLFLAQQLGPEGHVFAVDIQASAIQATFNNLETAGLLERVTLIQGDHGKLDKLMEDCPNPGMDLICFNLGYLPGGDHERITSAENTIMALKGSLKLLNPSGRLSVIAYRGHPGGMKEAQSVEAFFKSLPEEWQCLQFVATGSEARPGPVWWLYARDSS